MGEDSCYAEHVNALESRVRGIPICCTIRSETNEADDALSNSALASIDDPSGEVTNTRQVIRRVLDVNV